MECGYIAERFEQQSDVFDASVRLYDDNCAKPMRVYCAPRAGSPIFPRASLPHIRPPFPALAPTPPPPTRPRAFTVRSLRPVRPRAFTIRSLRPVRPRSVVRSPCPRVRTGVSACGCVLLDDGGGQLAGECECDGRSCPAVRLV